MIPPLKKLVTHLLHTHYSVGVRSSRGEGGRESGGKKGGSDGRLKSLDCWILMNEDGS